MLVLTRKLNEQIKIGNDITITVIKLRNNQIRLGIEAPRDVRVLRAELEKMVASGGITIGDADGHETDTDVIENDAVVAEQKTEYRSRIDVVDGVVSADEMIAAGSESDDDGEGCGACQVFSGRIGVDGELRENTPSRPALTPSPRAPLAAYFTAP